MRLQVQARTCACPLMRCHALSAGYDWQLPLLPDSESLDFGHAGTSLIDSPSSPRVKWNISNNPRIQVGLGEQDSNKRSGHCLISTSSRVPSAQVLPVCYLQTNPPTWAHQRIRMLPALTLFCFLYYVYTCYITCYIHVTVKKVWIDLWFPSNQVNHKDCAQDSQDSKFDACLIMASWMHLKYPKLLQ